MRDWDRNKLALQVSQHNQNLGTYLRTIPLDHPDLREIQNWKMKHNFRSAGFAKYSTERLRLGKAKDALVLGHERFGLSKAEAEYVVRNAPGTVIESAVYGSQANSNDGPRNWLKAKDVKIAPQSTTLSDQAAQAKNAATSQNVDAINNSVSTETGAPIRSTGTSATPEVKPQVRPEQGKFPDQKVFTGAGGSVPFLDAEGRLLSNTLNGTDFRNEVELSRSNLEFTERAKAWNAHIDLAADKLEKKGRFSNPDGSPKMSNYRRTKFVGGVNPDYPDALTAKEEWKLSRQLDYGHIGAASNPSWRYGVNWMSNAGPEFSLYNRSESMSETIYEALAADKALRENKGLTWSQGNKRRFDKILKELADEGLSPEFNLGYFSDMTIRDMTPRDLARIRAHDIIANGGTPPDELLMSGIEPQRMREGMRSNIANVGQEGAGSVLLLNQSMPMADTESFIAGNRKWLDKNAVKNASSPGNIIDIVRSATPEQIKQFRKDVAKAGKTLRGQDLGLTPENITKALRGVGGASTLMLLSNIARADGEGGLEKFINGLNLMEAQTVQGDEAISNIPGVQQVKDLWGGLVNFLNENVDTVNVGPGGTYQAPVENVGDSLDAGQNVVNPYWDIAALTGSMMADQAQDVVTEQQPYYNGPGFGNYSTIPTPSIVIDEHDAKVNRGLVRNIWTNDD